MKYLYLVRFPEELDILPLGLNQMIFESPDLLDAFSGLMHLIGIKGYKVTPIPFMEDSSSFGELSKVVGKLRR